MSQPKQLINDKKFIEAMANACRQDFFCFVAAFWDTFISEPPIWNWHIYEICKELQRVGERVRDRLPAEFDFLLINVPPGSSKTSIISILYPIWCWTIDQSQRFICGSSSSTISEDIADKALRVLRSDRFKAFFPEIVLLSEAKTKIQNNANGERYTTSVTSDIHGIHAHQIIVDDGISAQDANSEAKRAEANNFITNVLPTRKADKEVAAMVYVAQLFNLNDPSCHILELEKKGLRIKRICLPAELNPDPDKCNVFPKELRDKYTDGLLDPVRMSREVLARAKIFLGSSAYEGQFNQNPSDPKGETFQREWFEIIEPSEIDVRAARHFQIDTAYTEQSENDPSGILPFYIRNGTMYITNWKTVRKTFPDFCKFLPLHVKAHGYSNRSLIGVEPKASGKSVVQELKAKTNLNIKESANPEGSKKARAEVASVPCEAGRVKLIRGHWNEEFLDELCAFPKGKHDEAVDCLSEAIRKYLTGKKDQDLVKIFAGGF